MLVLGPITAIAMDPTADQHDPPLDTDDLQDVAVLAVHDIETIDRSLLAASPTSWRKVALVVSVAMDAYPGLYLVVPDVFYAQRVRALVATGHLQARGNLQRMRSSEIRLSGV